VSLLKESYEDSRDAVPAPSFLLAKRLLEGGKTFPLLRRVQLVKRPPFSGVSGVCLLVAAVVKMKDLSPPVPPQDAPRADPPPSAMEEVSRLSKELKPFSVPHLPPSKFLKPSLSPETAVTCPRKRPLPDTASFRWGA